MKMRVRGWSAAGGAMLAAGLVAAALGVHCRLSRATAPATMPATAATLDLEMKILTFRGVEGCLESKAGKARLVVVPAWAGRISTLDFGWGNVAFNDPKVDGKVLKPNEPWAPWDGNATDLVQRIDGKMKNQWKGLWLHPYVLHLPFSLESPPSEEAKLKVVKTYLLRPDSCIYSCEIRNTGDQPARWTVWERLLVPGGADAYVICPLKKGDAYKDGYIIRDNTTVEPADRVQAVGDYLVMRAGTTKGAGLAAQLSRRWMASVSGRHALLMTYGGVDDKAQYPHYDGANAVFWVAAGNVEMEPLSPEVSIPAGKSYEFPQVWYGLDLPDLIDPADCAAVGKWLDGEAAKRLNEWPARPQPASARAAD